MKSTGGASALPSSFADSPPANHHRNSPPCDPEPGDRLGGQCGHGQRGQAAPARGGWLQTRGGCPGAAGAGAAALLLRAAIPKHSFQRSFVTSTYYMIQNVLTCAALFYAATFIDRTGAAAYLL
ncbi:hypothetical protein PF005_g32355 [Phytophthora fragariae]|uniref:Uncharacterized protein n=2 Tax=Phytophthora fragariae TaxID=53985 RepID=A0A6A3V4L7_9STRA|nr:hypothetical protein PF005_g32355 [Phytophthora fragariae]